MRPWRLAIVVARQPKVTLRKNRVGGPMDRDGRVAHRFAG